MAFKVLFNILAQYYSHIVWSQFTQLSKIHYRVHCDAFINSHDT